MSYSVSTLPTRTLHDVFGETTLRVSARPSTSSSPKIVCSRRSASWDNVTAIGRGGLVKAAANLDQSVASDRSAFS